MTKRNFTLFRVLTSFIFIYAGANHLLHPDKILGKVSKSTAYAMLDMPLFFSSSVLLSGMGMIVFGLMLAAGYKQKLAALALLIILIPITLTVQLENLSDLGPFFKNVAIAGSLLFIIKQSSNEIQPNVIAHSNASR